MSHKIFRLTKTIKNPSYDRRCRYGIEAVPQFDAGMIWIFVLPNDKYLAGVAKPPEGLTSEQKKHYMDEMREEFGTIKTPKGTVAMEPALRESMFSNSEPSTAQTVEEMLFCNQMQYITADEVLAHLVSQHGWKMAEVQQVLEEIRQLEVERDAKADKETA